MQRSLCCNAEISLRRVLELPLDIKEVIANKLLFQEIIMAAHASPMFLAMSRNNFMEARISHSFAVVLGNQRITITTESNDEVMVLLGFPPRSPSDLALGRAHVKRLKRDFATKWELLKRVDKTYLRWFLEALLPFQSYFIKYAKLYADELSELGTSPMELHMYSVKNRILPRLWRTEEKLVITETKVNQERLQLFLAIKDSVPVENLNSLETSIRNLQESIIRSG